MGRWLLLGLFSLTPLAAFAQSAGEVERCFQNPEACSSSGGTTPAPTPPAPPPAATRPASPPDYTTVLKGSDPDRRKLQESLRTLDKYNGPIDGNLQSPATEKAIGDWQKGHGYAAVGKLTPSEAVALNNEAARAPIKRISPPATIAATPAPSNADSLKILLERLAERRKAAEPKAQAATQSLVRDLKAYVAADGKGVAGDQFADFAKWYADNKAAGRTVGDITSMVDDYGEVKTGAAAAAEVKFETKQGDKTYQQCLMFAWVESSSRKDTQAFSCDDVAGLEKWKTGQALKSAWR